MNSRFVVDPCISLETLELFLQADFERAPLRVVDSYESYGSCNVFTSRFRPVNSFSEVRILTPYAFNALFLVERGILILPGAFKESVMIFTDRQRLSNILHEPTTTGTLRLSGSVMYDNDLVMKMHGSTTTREYIRRFVRLLQMDKSALRVNTSRQYYTYYVELSNFIPA